MTDTQKQELLAFFREHRSNEANYGQLSDRMEAAAREDQGLGAQWQSIREKQGGTYEQAKETGGSAWPEFEAFVTACEKALLEQ